MISQKWAFRSRPWDLVPASSVCIRQKPASCFQLAFKHHAVWGHGFICALTTSQYRMMLVQISFPLPSSCFVWIIFFFYLSLWELSLWPHTLGVLYHVNCWLGMWGRQFKFNDDWTRIPGRTIRTLPPPVSMIELKTAADSIAISTIT